MTVVRVHCASVCRFQSLTGRLKTSYRNPHAHTCIKFQSLTGRLKTCAIDSGESIESGFNPSQVG